MSASILLTGATGYIGGRLLRSLEEGGHAVRCLARQPARVRPTSATTEVVAGDCLDEASLDDALAGVKCAYYLVHSMASGSQFADLDRQAADNFGRAAARAGVRRIVYLGGLADDTSALSAHLRSRVETGDVLRASGVPIIEFRASVIIGAGSLSFQMIQALVERLPVMVCPRWVSTPTQPIAINDVLAYLLAALEVPQSIDSGGRVFEIGGPDVVSYGDMMREYARIRGLHRLLLPVPVLTPHLSGLWLALVTPSQARVGRALVDGLKNPSVVRSPDARTAFAIEPMTLRRSFINAIEDGTDGRLKTDTRTVVVNVPPARAFEPVRRVGGASGWYFGDRLWKTRAWIDRRFGGVGMRGRLDADGCRVGDVIDTWTVEAYEPDRRLRLSADLKLPGRGWLEFEVLPLDNGRSSIRQTATFDPRGVLGSAYWYAIYPFHALIFRGLLRRIALRAELGTAALVVVAMSMLTVSVHARQPAPVRTVASVDLERYLGEWFEISRFPNRFQESCVADVRARYVRRPDERIDVINRCQTEKGLNEARGVARVIDPRTSAKLKVRFAPALLSWLPSVWGDYWILGLADDYSWAVVGTPDRKYLWILARTPRLDDERLARALRAARENGFDTSRLVGNSPTP